MINHKTIRNIILASASSLCLCVGNVNAAESVIKVGSVVTVQGAYYKSNGTDQQQKFSSHKKRYGLDSSGNFLINYQLVSDSGLKYGTKIGLEQTTRNDRGTPMSIYVETDYGKLEVGSDKSAGKKMKITGYSSSCTAGNGWDSYIIASPKSGSTTLVPYISNFCSFLDSKTRTSRLADYSRKVTYFTPKFGNENNKVQVGVSYAPDTSNAGHSVIKDNVLHTPVSGSAYKFAIKDGISYGISYEGKLGEELKVKLAFVGEKGKTVAFEKASDEYVKSAVKFKDLNTYNIGGEVVYNQFSVSGSYMNYNKSLTNQTLDTRGRNTSLYALGAKYNFCETKYSASLNYFHSEHKKNKLDATSVGLDYFITEGIKSYAQATYYKANGFDLKNNIKNKSKGTIVILGSKISL